MAIINLEWLVISVINIVNIICIIISDIFVLHERFYMSVFLKLNLHFSYREYYFLKEKNISISFCSFQNELSPTESTGLS